MVNKKNVFSFVCKILSRTGSLKARGERTAMRNQKWKAMVLRALNHCFPRPVHPFNLRNASELSYAEWQYEKAPGTLRYYLERYSIEEMFAEKRVLDFGCGEGGKSVYYAGLGAKQVVGVDLMPEYEERAMRFAEKHG